MLLVSSSLTHILAHTEPSATHEQLNDMLDLTSSSHLFYIIGVRLQCPYCLMCVQQPEATQQCVTCRCVDILYVTHLTSPVKEVCIKQIAADRRYIFAQIYTDRYIWRVCWIIWASKHLCFGKRCRNRGTHIHIAHILPLHIIVAKRRIMFPPLIIYELGINVFSCLASLRYTVILKAQNKHILNKNPINSLLDKISESMSASSPQYSTTNSNYKLHAIKSQWLIRDTIFFFLVQSGRNERNVER